MNGIFDDLKNAFRRNDNALMQLIIINVVVFLGLQILKTTLIALMGQEWLYVIIDAQFSLPASLTDFVYYPWTIITYAFNHAGIWHILFNMLFLYWFGLIIVEYIGSKRLISLYILGALAGSLSFLLIYSPLSHNNAHLVGASAAVFAVMVGAATLTPNYVFHLFLLGPVRIKYIAVVFIILSYIQLAGSNAGGDLAHLAGTLVGFVYIKQLKSGRDIGGWINTVMDWIQNLFTRKPKIRVTYSNLSKDRKSKVAANTNYQGYKKNTNASFDEIPDQEEIDTILDKISESGYESLTKEEKQKLFRASSK